MVCDLVCAARVLVWHGWFWSGFPLCCYVLVFGLGLWFGVFDVDFVA